MGELGSAVRPRLDDVARVHGFSLAATACLHRALAAGGGMAQFSHPELGGLGQWAGGGMIMIGEMGNAELRRRVGALCVALAALPADVRVDAGTAAPAATGDAASGSRPWWPAALGRPASSGSQGQVAYAWFPQARRLAVRHADRVALYDTGAHGITGVSQGSGAASPVRLHAGTREIGLFELVEAGAGGWTRPRVVEAAGEPVPLAGGEVLRGGDAPDRAGGGPDDPLATIERLAGLRAAGVLTDGEFAAKKAELLARV